MELKNKYNNGDYSANGTGASEMFDDVDRYLNASISNNNSFFDFNQRWKNGIGQFISFADDYTSKHITLEFSSFSTTYEIENAYDIFNYKGLNISMLVKTSASNVSVFIPKKIMELNTSFVNTEKLYVNTEIYVSDNAALQYTVYKIDNIGTETLIGGARTNQNVISGINILNVEVPAGAYSNTDQYLRVRIFDSTDNQLEGKTLKIGRIYCGSARTKEVELTEDIKNDILTRFSQISPEVSKVHVWGDSISNGTYQGYIAVKFGLRTTDIINHAVSGDPSFRIRESFVSYYTANPEELKHPIIIMFGANNLLPITGTDYLKDIHIQSYKDHYFRDINAMISMIPHNMFIVSTAWTSNSANSGDIRYDQVNSVNDELLKAYPNNSFDSLRRILLEYDFGNAYLTADFIQPSIGANVVVSVNDASIVTHATRNSAQTIAIGTKEIYDEYTIISVASNDITLRLDVNNTGIAPGQTFNAIYTWITSYANEIDIPTRIYALRDCIDFQNNKIPHTASDGLHPLYAYDILGNAIADELLKIINKSYINENIIL